jgi:hypothetical protein
MAETEKLDLYKLHKDEYAAAKSPVLVSIARAKYLAVEGQGAPGDEAFVAGVGALYAAAFTVKMTSKFAGRDYKVCTLEALWWADGQDADFLHVPRSRWRWQLLIRQPDFIRKPNLTAAVEALLAKGKAPEVAEVRLETLAEGRCVQMLHVGPYADEARTIGAMAAHAAEQGLALHGRHHEIYLSDPRRVPPERLRTILRHPVRKA